MIERNGRLGERRKWEGWDRKDKIRKEQRNRYRRDWLGHDQIG
jgi:hypothetical protein